MRKLSLFLLVFLSLVLFSPAFPESTGGSVGKQGKSISGSDETAPSPEPGRPAAGRQKTHSHRSKNKRASGPKASITSGKIRPGCGPSCSAARANCISGGAPAPICAGLYEKCLQTGHWEGLICNKTGLARR
jgi:hypothetical protein